ncbi:MAG: translation initiation factor IF-2 subunit beta [Nanoarchaeota archaeon]
MDYEKMLKRAQEQLPKQTSSGERFEIPKATGRVEGNKTIITNFKEITDQLRRTPELIIKYLQRELAAPVAIDGPRLVLNRKLQASLVNAKIEQFAKDAVICKQCSKPDTTLIKQETVTIMICSACGARNTIKGKI